VGLVEGIRVLAGRAGVPELGAASLKAGLDLDWDDPAAVGAALGAVVEAVGQVQRLAEVQPGGDHPRVAWGLAAAEQVQQQDVTVDQQGRPSIRQGVAKDRRISICDPQMRHGRKTRSVRVDGYKRHVLRDLDHQLIRAVGVTPANVPEAAVAEQVQADLDAQQVRLSELHIDRAYLPSRLVRDRDPDLIIYCKAFPVRALGGRYAKTAFLLDFEHGELVCPNQIRMAFTPGGKVQFPAEVCRVCPLRSQCTTSPRGRSVQIHPDERLLVELRQQQQPHRAAPGCASESPSNTPWPMSATGRAIAPATLANARTCSTYAAPRWSTTCTSSPASHTKPSKPLEPAT
jgi:hypothetical protein